MGVAIDNNSGKLEKFPFSFSFIAFLLCLFLLFTVVVWSPVAMDAETIVVSLYTHVDIE